MVELAISDYLKSCYNWPLPITDVIISTTLLNFHWYAKLAVAAVAKMDACLPVGHVFPTKCINISLKFVVGNVVAYHLLIACITIVIWFCLVVHT